MELMYNKFLVAKVVVNSTFKLSRKPFLMRSSQGDPFNAADLIVNRAATSIRQLSEWGMRQIQGVFPQMKDSILLEETGDRTIIL